MHVLLLPPDGERPAVISGLALGEVCGGGGGGGGGGGKHSWSRDCDYLSLLPGLWALCFIFLWTH